MLNSLVGLEEEKNEIYSEDAYRPKREMSPVADGRRVSKQIVVFEDGNKCE
jgi:hypothetical protein